LATEFNNNRSLYDELSRKDFPLDQLDYVVMEYSDYFEENGERKFRSKNLGEKFASINSFFLDYLKEYHIPSAFVKIQGSNSLKYIKHGRLPFIIKILNVVDKRTARIFSKKENVSLSLPIFEMHYGTGKETLISDSHLLAFDLCTNDDLKIIYRICSKVNAVLRSFFERRDAVLAEVSLAFGKGEEKIYLVDDFTPKSIKIIPTNKDDKWVNPYKLDTLAIVKKYTDHLYNLMSS